MAITFNRRSLLYVPGTSLHMMKKALDSAADGVILDLEDAVATADKEMARKNVTDFIQEAKTTSKEVIVRINPVDSYLGLLDLMALIPKAPHALIIPKASVETLGVAEMILQSFEKEFDWQKNTIRLIPLIETVRGVIEAREIVEATNRTIAVHLGGEDLTNELGIERTAEGRELFFARSQVVFAAKSRGLAVIDAPYVDFKNPNGLAIDCKEAKSLGMTGKVCIHPVQIAKVNEAFSPSEKEINRAVEILETYERTQQSVFTVDGKMVDAPIIQKAQQTVVLAKQYGLLSE